MEGNESMVYRKLQDLNILDVNATKEEEIMLNFCYMKNREPAISYTLFFFIYLFNKFS